MRQSPRDYGVPHEEWRPNQFEAIQNVMKVHNDNGGFIIQELATGSGKSGVATALSAKEKVLVLVQNHGLLDQYEKVYGFDIVKGKQEYPCVLDTKVKNWRANYGIEPTAADCHLQNMHNCNDAHHCPYLIAREKALGSDRAACTYKYATLSNAIRDRNGILVMDEAHLSADEILSTAVFEINSEVCKKYNLPDIPYQEFGTNNEGDIANNDDRFLLEAWFEVAMQKVAVIDLFDIMTPTGAKMRHIFTMLEKGRELLRLNPQIFIKIDDREDRFNRKKKSTVKVMTLKPMDAKQVAKSLWHNKRTTLLMSATIGLPDPLARELGIFKFDHFSYPHPIPAQYRPVFDLKVSRMVKTNLDRNRRLYNVQGAIIQRWIQSLPPVWRGIVLTTSYYKIEKLRNYFNSRMPGRVYMPPSDIGLDERIQAFKQHAKPGQFVVETIQGWGTGVDLYGDTGRFAVVAGVPFVNPSDRYEIERLRRPHGTRYALWTAYNAIPQACGRVSRGEMNDDGSYLINVAAIADGSAVTSQAKYFYPKWFTEAITDY